MNLSQDAFNKVVTTSLMLFFMVMYVVSFVTGKNIDWTGLLAFIVPTVNHIVHQVTASQIQTKNVDKDIAVIQASSTTNGVSH